MNELPDEVKAELSKRVESKLVSFHVISLLKMMLSKPEKKVDPGIQKKELMQEHKEDAKEAVAEIIDLVSKTVRTGKVPDHEAA